MEFTRSLSFALLALAACSSSSTLLPDGAVAPVDAGTAGGGDGSAPPGSDVWDGYIESFMFPSGSDHVHIVFDPASGDGPRTGTIVFGMGTPPAPPTDAHVGYPPGAFSSIGGPGPGEMGPTEGFAYPITMGSVAGPRVRATAELASFWDAWCRLQTPVLYAPGSMDYACLPNTGGGGGSMGCYYDDPVTSMPVYADCGWIALCGPMTPCACTAASCAAGTVQQISFDFHVTGTDGTGTVDIMGLHNVYLTD